MATNIRQYIFEAIYGVLIFVNRFQPLYIQLILFVAINHHLNYLTCHLKRNSFNTRRIVVIQQFSSLTFDLNFNIFH